MVERAQVSLFLDQMRACATCNFRLERRTKNMETLAQLGMTIKDAKSRILRLTLNDYVSGPTPRSENSSQEAWVFQLEIDGVVIYVKVSIRLEPARCLCVSFHEAERPMMRPYAQEAKGER